MKDARERSTGESALKKLRKKQNQVQKEAAERCLEMGPCDGGWFKPSEPNEGNTRHASGDADGIAKAGWVFHFLASPQETWDTVFDTLLGELSAAGYETLTRNLKKMTTDRARYKHCEVICVHSGQQRETNPMLMEDKRRKRTSKNVGSLDQTCCIADADTLSLRRREPKVYNELHKLKDEQNEIRGDATDCLATEDGNDLPWPHEDGQGWDGHREGDDENDWGPTFDDKSEGVHTSKSEVRTAQDSAASDTRRVFAMAKSKDYVGDIT